MVTRLLFVLCILMSTTLATAQLSKQAMGQEFAQWLAGVRQEAIAQGISAAAIDPVLSQVRYDPSIVERDQSQPEFVSTFWTYIGRAVSQERVLRGREALQQYAGVLSQIEQRYGVPRHYIVAFWAVESNFGEYQGSFPVIQSIATRAYERRARGGFRAQLIDALRMVANGVPSSRMTGSWAGAMGQPQFMPSAFLTFAVDFDGNGFPNIWDSEPDVFASIANYLAGSGWQRDQLWGREVVLPSNFDWQLTGRDTELSLAQWQQLGVRRVGGSDLPVGDIAASVVLPAGHQGPAFLVYDNFDAILAYNRAEFYALTIGHLADRLAGRPGLSRTAPANDRALRYDEIREIQQRLNSLGFDAGPVDGIPGGQTARAVRAFQGRIGVPADGFISPSLLDALRRAS
ncbi:MAG: lytic murein transglycosylase [Pseudomonadota bacterium]